MGTSRKTVASVDEYTQGGKEYVTIKTYGGWIYRFRRLRTNEPYVYDMRQRPGMNRHNTRKERKVVEYTQTGRSTPVA